MKRIYIKYFIIFLCVSAVVALSTYLILNSRIKSTTPALPPEISPETPPEIPDEIPPDLPPIKPEDIDLIFEPASLPNQAHPVDPKDYSGLIIPEPSENGGAGSLFYIGKSDYNAMLKNIEISGSFSLGDGIPTYQSFYSIIILSPEGYQKNFFDESLNNSVIDEEIKPWFKFDFSHSHNFLKRFQNINNFLEKNSNIFLYVFGSKTSPTQIATPTFTIYNPKLILNIHT
jgi:hypothetical protein